MHGVKGSSKMKRSLTLSLAVFFVACQATLSFSQSLSFTKTMDDPDKAINTMISVAPVEAYIPSGKYGGLSVGIGASGVYGYTSRIGFEGALGTSYINTTGGTFTYAEGGAFLNLRIKEKTKNTRVLLGYSRKLDVRTTTTTTTYMEVPAKVKIATGFRGGLQYSNIPVKTDGIKVAAASSTLNLAGIYAGIQTTNKHLIKTLMRGETEPTPTGALFKLYADALLYGVSEIAEPALDAKLESGNVGWRAGLTWVVAPYTKKEHPNYKAFLHRLNISSEIGSRPIDGFYIKMGAGWAVFQK
ncbi:MAG: hypothetical protein K0S09_3051 [Sphingobacteriaceae bacterium]|jgi:hypothetical protein|nr:hypothetical protein [Sphingobacteriaceae bacterium]